MSIINVGLFSKALKEDDYRRCLNNLKAEIDKVKRANLAEQLSQKIYGVACNGDQAVERRDSFRLEVTKVILEIDSVVKNLDENLLSNSNGETAEARYQTLQKQTQKVIDAYNKLVTHRRVRHKATANTVISAFENIFSRLADVLRSALGMTKKGNFVRSDAQKTLADNFNSLLSVVSKIQKDMKSQAVSPKKATGFDQDPLYGGHQFSDHYEMPNYTNSKSVSPGLMYQGF